MKLVHAHVYDPTTPGLLVKQRKSDAAEHHTITCSASERCELFAAGQCILRRFMGPSCPNGRASIEHGPTERARNFYVWMNERREAAQKIGSLKEPPPKIARVGDDLYLPYSVLAPVLRGEDCESYPRASPLVPTDLFTAENIARACELQPRGIFGGVIHDYQREAVPLFVAHLSESFPDLLREAAALSPRIRAIMATLTKVGRKARLHTLRPNVGSFEGWTWDGTHMITRERSAFPPFTKFGAQEVRILPSEGAEIKITNDAQVTPETVFLD